MGYKDSSILSVTSFVHDDAGLILFGAVRGVPPTVASKFAPGAILLDTINGIVYFNNGNTATPEWVEQGGGSSADRVVSVLGTGTAAASVWPGGAPANLTITRVWLISNDTTAGNVTVENPASTVVATIAKGATAGALVGAVSLANTAVTKGTDVIVDCSSAGVAQVFIHYRLA